MLIPTLTNDSQFESQFTQYRLDKDLKDHSNYDVDIDDKHDSIHDDDTEIGVDHNHLNHCLQIKILKNM